MLRSQGRTLQGVQHIFLGIKRGEIILSQVQLPLRVWLCPYDGPSIQESVIKGVWKKARKERFIPTEGGHCIILFLPGCHTLRNTGTWTYFLNIQICFWAV